MNNIKKNSSILVVVDIQGALADMMVDRDQVFQKINLLAGGTEILGLPQVLTEQMPEKLGSTRSEVADALANAVRIAKATFSCCGEPGFVESLAETGRDQILLCGIEAHICVLQTGLDLISRGYEVFLVRDGVSSRNALDRDVAIERLRDSGACIVTAETALYEMLKTAEGDDFKQVLKLVKSIG